MHKIHVSQATSWDNCTIWVTRQICIHKYKHKHIDIYIHMYTYTNTYTYTYTNTYKCLISSTNWADCTFWVTHICKVCSFHMESATNTYTNAYTNTKLTHTQIHVSQATSWANCTLWVTHICNGDSWTPPRWDRSQTNMNISWMNNHQTNKK